MKQKKTVASFYICNIAQQRKSGKAQLFDGLKALKVVGGGGAVFLSFFRLSGLSESIFLISAGGSFQPWVNCFLFSSGPVGISVGGFNHGVLVF